MYENVSPSEPQTDSVPLDQIKATVEEVVPSHEIKATGEDADQYTQEDCRIYEDISITEVVTDSVPQDQIAPTVEEPGQNE